MGEHAGGLRVGDVAAVTGLTVRALHHYEAIGLVVPGMRSDVGHRIYGQAEIERVYRVLVLRSFGLSLSTIRESIDGEPARLPDLLADHTRAVEAQIARQQRLRARLAIAMENLGLVGEASTDFLPILEEMMRLEPMVERRISILVYADVEAAHHYLVQVFALSAGELTRDSDGHVVHAVVQAGDGEVWLHAESAHFGLSSPRRLGAATATMAVLVDDVDTHHRRAVAAGAAIAYPPTDQPYGLREYGARDLEGHLWAFMHPLEPEVIHDASNK